MVVEFFKGIYYGTLHCQRWKLITFPNHVIDKEGQDEITLLDFLNFKYDALTQSALYLETVYMILLV